MPSCAYSQAVSINTAQDSQLHVATHYQGFSPLHAVTTGQLRWTNNKLKVMLYIAMLQLLVMLQTCIATFTANIMRAWWPRLLPSKVKG